jgi:hypothetical protein
VVETEELLLAMELMHLPIQVAVAEVLLLVVVRQTVETEVQELFF